MDVPIMTQEQSDRIEQSKADYIESWMQSMREQPGNPFGIAIQHFGRARAFAARNLAHVGLFNRVIGIGPEHTAQLDDIVRFYELQGVPYRIDINPYRVSTDLLAGLVDYGFHESMFQSMLYGVPSVVPLELPPSVTIQDVTFERLERFVDVYMHGFQEALHGQGSEVGLLGSALEVLYGRAGWQFSLVSVDEKPASIGLLYIQDGVASLAGGATIPSFRNRGGQTVTLAHRFTLAAEANSSLIVGQAEAGSVIQTNMERIGMRIAYTRAMWTRIRPSRT
ncbi:MAG TPA: hypothetical protein VGL94_11720 [Ktedonobacteraceae bacterium]|jgi:hypothetical protein